ncbi:hypothetical protein LZ086_17130 [Acinetobacter johnsonii]|nr:hypothetical protein LZ086_17130 [Acinetobacter johnsonii]
MCCLGESNKLLNTPPITAPAIPPSNGDSGKGRVLEIDAPIVARRLMLQPLFQLSHLPVDSSLERFDQKNSKDNVYS